MALGSTVACVMAQVRRTLRCVSWVRVEYIYVGEVMVVIYLTCFYLIPCSMLYIYPFSRILSLRTLRVYYRMAHLSGALVGVTEIHAAGGGHE